MTHDINRQINYIQQVLSQDRKSIGLFLGAGCPLSIRIINGENNEPLIPDIAGLTNIISAKIKAGADKDIFEKLTKQFVDDQIDNPNIEDYLSRIRSLITVAGNGKVRDLTKDELNRLDASICKIVSEEVDKELPSNQSPYHDLALWIRSISRSEPVHLFTSNYDLLMEQALEESHCPYFDGFIGTRKAFFDLGSVENPILLPSNWCRLWKIHGSINWVHSNTEGIIRSNELKEEERFLIYPSHLKYNKSRKMPYLAMMDRLKSFLLKPSSVLFISGYSFSDEHINDIILRSLQSNPTAMCFSLLFGDLDNYPLAKECANQGSNISLLARDKAIIGRNEAKYTLNGDTLLNNLPNELILTEEDNEGEEVIKNHFFNIGDFAMFGKLLRTLSGSEQNNFNHAE